MSESIYYCLKCGNIEPKYDDKNQCIWCKSIMKNTVVEAWDKEKTFNELIKGNPQFAQKAYNRRMDEHKEIARKNVADTKLRESGSREVTCPKCGSKQIQAVNKKWSLFSGFLTNKTQRFCLNCKHKF